MATTLTRYLKLKVDSSLSDDAKYNLNKIDSLGGSGLPDSSGQVNIRSVTDILIEPESADVGGSGNSTGTIQLGESDNQAAVLAFSTSFKIRSPLSLSNGINNNEPTYFSIAVPSDTNNNCTLTIDTGGSDYTITFDNGGTVLIKNATQTVTNKTISGSSNTLTNIAYSSLLLSNTITNSDINSGAAIADTKLATISTAGKVSNSATTATSSNTTSAIVSRDISGNFSAGIITANLNGIANNVSGVVDIVNGGTGETTAAAAINALLPPQSGNSDKVLKTDGTNVYWVTPATGQVQTYVTTWTSGLTKTVTHNLGTKNVFVVVKADSFNDGETVLTDVLIYTEIQAIDNNTVLLTSTEVPTGTWTITVQGAP
jgi:hypothetical protein